MTSVSAEPTVIVPKNEDEWLAMRANDVTSTEVSALFGCCPYLTEFELWHRKRSGQVVRIEVNERMKWGTRLQDVVALGVAEDQGWTVRRMPEYLRLPGLRLGSSFDYLIERAAGVGESLLEIKCVDGLAFRDGWVEHEDGELEAPPHIELQVQHQMLVSGRRLAFIAALVGGNKVHLIRREYDPQIGSMIREKAHAFWRSVDAGVEPSPDFERDAGTICRLYGYAQPGKVFDAHGDAEIAQLCAEYNALGREQKALGERRDGIKARLLMRIGDAEKVLTEGFTISAGLVGPADVSYRREGYRNLRVYEKKAKVDRG